MLETTENRPVLLLLVAFLTSASGYNVDTTHPIVRESGLSGTESAAFGVSVGVLQSGSKRR